MRFWQTWNRVLGLRLAGSSVAIFILILPGFAGSAKAADESMAQDLLRQAQAALQAHDYRKAVKLFKDANKQQNNQCFDCFLGEAIASTQLNENGNADASVLKAINLAANPQQRVLAHRLRGQLLTVFSRGDAKKLHLAEEEYRQALLDAPSDGQSHFELGLALMRQNKDDEGRKELLSSLTLAPDLPNAALARKLIADPQRARQRMAPDFEVTTLQGETLSLQALAGKVVVLDFWATWCPPCRESVGDLKNIVKKYPREQLVLISISADDKEETWKEFVTRKKMDWPQYRDTDKKILRTFGVRAFPTYMVTDGSGVIQSEIVGENPQQSIVHQLKTTLAAMKNFN